MVLETVATGVLPGDQALSKELADYEGDDKLKLEEQLKKKLNEVEEN